MLVKNKTRDIAILRTMGAGQGSILRIFFLAGATIGGLFLGTLIIVSILVFLLAFFLAPALIVLALWALAWSLVNRVVAHRFHYLGHVVIGSFGVIAASLIAFGSVIAVGMPALFLTVDRPLVTRADMSDPAADPSCSQQGWLHLDRNCLSRRDLPWMAGPVTTSPGPVEAPVAPAAEQPLTEGRQAATTPEPSAPQLSPAR